MRVFILWDWLSRSYSLCMDILFKCFYISQCENNRPEISEKIIHKQRQRNKTVRIAKKCTRSCNFPRLWCNRRVVKRVQNSTEDWEKWINIGGRLNGLQRLFSVRCIAMVVFQVSIKRETKENDWRLRAGKVLIPFAIPDNVISRAFKRLFDALETHRSRASKCFFAQTQSATHDGRRQ